jgi:hypothetical protein
MAPASIIDEVRDILNESSILNTLDEKEQEELVNHDAELLAKSRGLSV